MTIFEESIPSAFAIDPWTLATNLVSLTRVSALVSGGSFPKSSSKSIFAFNLRSTCATGVDVVVEELDVSEVKLSAPL